MIVSIFHYFNSATRAECIANMNTLLCITTILIFVSAADVAAHNLNAELFSKFTSHFEKLNSISSGRLKRSSESDPSYQAFEEMAEQISDAAYFILDNDVLFQPAKEDNINVVLGMPKSGKTSLIKVLTSELSNILAIRKNNIEMNLISRNDLTESNFETLNYLPQVYEDELSNVYHEIPGFKYVKNATIDFAAGFFTKKLFDSANQIKIILTIPHYKILKPEYLKEIKYFLLHCGKLIRQYKRFSNSVSLVVTMADNSVQSLENGSIYTIYKTDEEIKSDTIDLLTYLKKNITEYETIYGQQRSNVIKLINILTYSKNNKTYNNIGLFKKSLKEGALNLDTEMQLSKKNLLEMIQDNLKFSTVKKSDTRYVAYYFENDDKYWYMYYTYFMEVGGFLKMIYTFFKLSY